MCAVILLASFAHSQKQELTHLDCRLLQPAVGANCQVTLLAFQQASPPVQHTHHIATSGNS